MIREQEGWCLCEVLAIRHSSTARPASFKKSHPQPNTPVVQLTQAAATRLQNTDTNDIIGLRFSIRYFEYTSTHARSVPRVVYATILAAFFAKVAPWISATSSSRADGKRLPSLGVKGQLGAWLRKRVTYPPVRVPAPQAEPPWTSDRLVNWPNTCL